MKKIVSIFLVLFAFSTLSTLGEVRVVSWHGSYLSKREHSSGMSSWTVADTYRLVLHAHKLFCERIVYYPAGSRYLYWINIENYYRAPNLSDSFVSTNAYNVPVIGIDSRGGVIANTNVLADYYNERTYPGGNGTRVIMLNESERLTIISQTSYLMDNSKSDGGYQVHFIFSVGGGTLATEKVRIGAGNVKVYTPSLEALSKIAKKKVSFASLVKIDPIFSTDLAGGVTKR